MIAVEVNYSPSQFVVKTDEDPDLAVKQLSCSWGYEDGDLVLYIEEDFIFDNTIDKLVFVPQEE